MELKEKCERFIDFHQTNNKHLLDHPAVVFRDEERRIEISLNEMIEIMSCALCWMDEDE